MTDRPTLTLQACADFLRRHIARYEQGRWDEIIAEDFRLRPTRAAAVRAWLPRNRDGHLGMLRQVLANQPQWLELPGMVMAMGAYDLAYPGEDGLCFALDRRGIHVEPLPDSVLLARADKPLPPAVIAAAGEAGICPWLLREVRRLGGRLPARRYADAVDAVLAVVWPEGATYDLRPGADEGGSGCGVCFAQRAHVPAGMAADSTVTLIGVDCYHYFGVRRDARMPLDCLVVTVDHEEEDQAPVDEGYASVWLATLKRETAG